LQSSDEIDGIKIAVQMVSAAMVKTIAEQAKKSSKLTIKYVMTEFCESVV
jgi:hypothetical protein